MKKTIIIIFLLFNTIAIFSQETNSNKTLELWTIFTIGDFVNENAHKIVSESWPFKTKSVAGDIIPEGLIDSVRNHNKRIWDKLDSMGIKNAEEKYYSELYEERTRIEKAIDILMKSQIVIALFKELRVNQCLNYTKLIKMESTKYQFDIYSFDLNGLDKPEQFEITAICDLNQVSIEIIK